MKESCQRVVIVATWDDNREEPLVQGRLVTPYKLESLLRDGFSVHSIVPHVMQLSEREAVRKFGSYRLQRVIDHACALAILHHPDSEKADEILDGGLR